VRRLVVNPLIVKDGLSRVRSWRAPASIGLYLGLLGLLGALFIQVQVGLSPRAWGLARIGSGAFTALAVTQLALVCLFTPAVAAGALSGERERQTLDVLVVSSLTPFAIVWGKLVASVAFILLLVTAALPLFATVFLFGGIDFGAFVVSQLLIVATALAIAAVSVFFSTVFRRTLTATVFAYGSTLAGVFGTWVVGFVLTQLTLIAQAGRPAPPHPLLFFNPVNAMLTALQASPTPVAGLGLGRFGPIFFGAGPTGPAGPSVDSWQVTVLAELAVFVVAIAAATVVLRGRRPIVLPAPTQSRLSEAAGGQ
jgi:ABC-type transport system involved in multi-copper enzyme maturation permease subunit